MIAVKSTLNFNLQPTPTTTNIEAIKGSIKLKTNKEIQLISAYKPPHKTITNEDLDKLLPEGKTTIVARDFSSKHKIWNSIYTDDGKKIEKYCVTNDAIPYCPLEHTHYCDNDINKSNIIDICSTKNYHQTVTMKTIHELTSNHLPVIFIVGNMGTEKDEKTITTFMN